MCFEAMRKIFVEGCRPFIRLDGCHLKGNFAVNLWTKKCLCGVWEISGLPCKHVAKCITYKRADIQDYCDPFYSMSIYIQAYSQILHPMLDIDMLPKGEMEIGQDTVLPPKRKKLIGRPKKKRKREVNVHRGYKKQGGHAL